MLEFEVHQTDNLWFFVESSKVEVKNSNKDESQPNQYKVKNSGSNLIIVNEK